ncbi:hypothetical protein K438DRAFT_1991120 [Mycena galopus ATCC 62051]|nr:hypothetical protein K438DRAFT_1991120 [Mycena galopus ATCC 62051]
MVPQKRKLGMSTGGGGNGHGSKVAQREGEGRVDVKPIDTGIGLSAGFGLGLGGGSSVGGAGLGSGASVGLGGAESGRGSGAGGLGQEGRDAQGVGEESRDEIRCRCGSSLNDGFSIACDVCGRWCYAACFAISKESVPEELVCWMCRRSIRTMGIEGRNRLPPAPFRSVVIAFVAVEPHAKPTMYQVKAMLEAVPVPVAD